jgi:hypothetical protein
MLQAGVSGYLNSDFHSRAESDVAYLWENLGLDWVYRPKRFILKNGDSHAPDFYLPSIRLWVDVMDSIDKISIPQVKGFCALIKDGRIDGKMLCHDRRKRNEIGLDYADYLLIGPDGAAMVEYQHRPHRRLPIREHGFISEATFLCCAHCGKWFFVGHTGDTSCRHCGTEDYLRAKHETALNLERGTLLVDSLPVAAWVTGVFTALA